RNHEDLG
ncbi:methyl-accepting chemotaxis domain protein, partial [Vibrio parahaemolyticus V-223/04]